MNNVDEINNMLKAKLQIYFDSSIRVMLTKGCGYQTLYLFGERESCLGMMKRIDSEFPSQQNNKQNLYWIVDREGTSIDVPRDEITRLTDFLRDNNVAAIYPLPASTVYQIYFDDHHSHLDSHH